jgi:hypothetical protein
VGYSFVRSDSDVAELQSHLKRLGGEELGIVLKTAGTRCRGATRRPGSRSGRTLLSQQVSAVDFRRLLPHG